MINEAKTQTDATQAFNQAMVNSLLRQRDAALSAQAQAEAQCELMAVANQSLGEQLAALKSQADLLELANKDLAERLAELAARDPSFSAFGPLGETQEPEAQETEVQGPEDGQARLAA